MKTQESRKNPNQCIALTKIIQVKKIHSSKRNLTLQSSIIFFRGKYTLYTTSIFSKAPGDFNNEESINKNNGSNVKNLTIHSKINDTIVYIENANENIQEKNERKQSKLKYEATIEEEDIQEKKEVKMNLQEKKEIKLNKFVYVANSDNEDTQEKK